MIIFRETMLKGAFIIELAPIADDRGFFARSFCYDEFKKNGLNPRVAQCNLSFNNKRGTLRGMHYQASPHAEAKLVSCIRGSIYDVIIDLRPNSATYCQWLAVELSSGDNRMLYVPEDFAHGFQTLADDTLVFYQMSEFYAPDSSRGVRWNDPAFAIRWPVDEKIISGKDRALPDFSR